MDPYLEAQGFWPDFHAAFITYWRDILADLLPDHYEIRMDERVNLVELPAGKIRRIEPDLALTQREPSRVMAAAPAGVATVEPVTIPLVIEEETRETYIEILHRPDRSLVGVLELLSPADKEEPGRGAYIVRRDALVRYPIHLVELDLLLGGRRLPLERDLPSGDFFALISRGDHRPMCEVYAWTVQRPLPAIPIPLKAPDPDLWLDLGVVFGTTYERGRYARSVDYDAPFSAGLPADTLDWVRRQATAGHRETPR
jgi:hypothetical protein